jgi:hypothetical protein
MKPHGSLQVFKMWCNEHAYPILRCFVNPKGLNYGDLPVSVVPELTCSLMV